MFNIGDKITCAKYVEKIKAREPGRYNIEPNEIGTIVNLTTAGWRVDFGHEIYDERTSLIMLEDEMEKV